ncbi:hypothetical protein KR044_012418, partial [Drosophila immigrans]
FAQRAPPPTYEQSQQQSYSYGQLPPATVQMHPHQMPTNQYYGMTHHQQLPAVYHHGVGASTSAGVPQVLQMDSRAEVRTTAGGAVVVPPPPPGCMPTAAQLAAMQGQPVVVQQKKRSFF